MQKTELLNRAAPAIWDKNILRALTNSPSDEAADIRLAKLAKRQATFDRWWNRALCVATPLAGLLYFAFGILSATSDEDKFMAGVFGILISFTIGVVLIGVAQCATSTIDTSEMWALKKASDADMCEGAVRDMEACPAARQWRDVALSERAELRVFDAKIMAALAKVQEWKETEERRLRDRDIACKTLHGVPLATAA